MNTLPLTSEYISEILKKNDFASITKLMNEGVDINLLVEPHHTDILLLALMRNGHLFIKRVFDLGFECNPKNGFLYIHHAIRTHDIFKLDLVINNYKKNSISIDEVSSNGDNCLHIAAREKNIPFSIIKYLSDTGISWFAKNNEGKTPLHILLEEHQIIPKELAFIINSNHSILDVSDLSNLTPLKIIKSNMNSDVWSKNNKDFLKEIRLI